MYSPGLDIVNIRYHTQWEITDAPSWSPRTMDSAASRDPWSAVRSHFCSSSSSGLGGVTARTAASLNDRCGKDRTAWSNLYVVRSVHSKSWAGGSYGFWISANDRPFAISPLTHAKNSRSILPLIFSMARSKNSQSLILTTACSSFITAGLSSVGFT